MAQTLVRLSAHAVFSTKERRHLIVPEGESDLYPYLSGILKNLGSPGIEVNGTACGAEALRRLQRPDGLWGANRRRRPQQARALPPAILCKPFGF